jgi:hypothetical protein
MGNDPALAIVRLQRNRNQGLNSLIALHERVNVLWERVNFPTVHGISTVARGTLGNGGH